MKLIDLQKCFVEKFCPFCNNSIENLRCADCNLTLDKHHHNYSCIIKNEFICLVLIYYGDAYYKTMSDRIYLTVFSLKDYGLDIELYNSWLIEFDNLLKISEDTTFDDVKDLLHKIYKIEVFK